MIFRPCIDLHAGIVKQIVGSTLSTKKENNELITNFQSILSPNEYALLYKKYNLSGGHVIMLGTNDRNKNAALECLKAFPNKLQIGGGINNENAEYYLSNGASHVIITSYLFKNNYIDMDKLKETASKIGKERLVIDLSCRKKNKLDNKYYVVMDKWQKFTDFQINTENLDMISNYCDEFLIHAVDVEGKKEGIEEDLVELLGTICSIPVTYAGGVHSIDDIKKIKRLGNNKIDFSIGSSLDIFGGHLSFHDIIKWSNNPSFI